MKAILVVFLALAVSLHAAAPAQSVERYQAMAVLKYPALKESGSPFNKQFISVVNAKRQSEPAFFNAPDWPLRAAELAATEMQAAENAAREKAKAEEAKAKAEELALSKMSKSERRAVEEGKEQAEKIAKLEADTEKKKDQWVFDQLIFGDSEEFIRHKLYKSKLVTFRAGPNARAELSDRFRWEVDERKFNIAFEMKDDALAGITFDCLPQRSSELDTIVKEDWDKLRAAAINLFGEPTKTIGFPTTAKLRRGGVTVTDVWERPGRPVSLGLRESEGKCNPTLKIADPTRGSSLPAM